MFKQDFGFFKIFLKKHLQNIYICAIIGFVVRNVLHMISWPDMGTTFAHRL